MAESGYAVVIGGVIGCWLWYLHSRDTSVITVRDLLTLAGMICGTTAVACIAIIDFVKSE